MRPCCLLGAIVAQGDCRRMCRTSDARLTVLPAPWEDHFGDSAEAAGDRRKTRKPFSGPESLGETRRAHPDPPKTALQERSGVRAFGRSKPRKEQSDSKYSHGWTLEIFCERMADLGDALPSLEGAYKTTCQPSIPSIHATLRLR